MAQFIDIPVKVGLLNSYKLDTYEPLVYKIPVTYLQNLSSGTMIIDSCSNIVLQARNKHVRVNNKMGIGLDPSSAYSLHVLGDTCISGNINVNQLTVTELSSYNITSVINDLIQRIAILETRSSNVHPTGWWGRINILNIIPTTIPPNTGNGLQVWLYENTFLIASRREASNTQITQNTDQTIEIPIEKRLITPTSVLTLVVVIGNGTNATLVGTPTSSGFTFTGSLATTAYLTMPASPYPSNLSLTYYIRNGVPSGWYGNINFINIRPEPYPPGQGNGLQVRLYEGTFLIASRIEADNTQINSFTDQTVPIPIEKRLYTPTSVLTLVVVIGNGTNATLVGTPTYSGFTFTGSLATTAYLTMPASPYPSNLSLTYYIRNGI
jgi:hypothetical protein